MSADFAIAGRAIGPDQPVYVVAELSANHGQRLERARELVEAAAEAGADAVKLQTYTADTLTLDSDRPAFRIGGGTLWDGARLHDLYAAACTPWEWHRELAALAAARGMHCFSSPFDESAVRFLEAEAAPAYKIASFELVDVPLLRAVAATGKPVIASTGMATLAEIEEAVETLRGAGAGPLALLRASSAYPSAPGDIHLRTLAELARRFGCVVGLSDHTAGIAVPVAAVALGAAIVEKHLTLRRADGGPDAAFSLEPPEFKAMVEAVRAAQAALGTVRFGPTASEAASLRFRRSLYVVKDMRAGERFTAEHVRSIRPAGGLHTRHLPEVLGRRAARDLERGTPLAWDDVA
jgi:N-acetylneuraminate synthase